MAPDLKVTETGINIMAQGNNDAYEHIRSNNGPEFTAREVKLVDQVSYGGRVRYDLMLESGRENVYNPRRVGTMDSTPWNAYMIPFGEVERFSKLNKPYGKKKKAS